MAVRIVSDATGLRHTASLPSSIDLWSWCAWFNIDDWQGDENTGLYIGSGTGDWIEIFTDTSKTPKRWVNGDDGTQANGITTAISTGTWYWVGGTIDNISSNQAWAYVAQEPGVLLASASAIGVNTCTSPTAFEIGIGPFGTSSYHLNGNVACVKVWTRAMTAGQMLRESGRYLPVLSADLWGFWPLLGTTITEAKRDFSGNGRTLINNGSDPTVVDGPPIPWGAAPIFIAGGTTYSLSGVTKDAAGDPLGSCDVFLCKDNGDDTATWLQHTTSHASTGAYLFEGITDNTAAYFVIAFKNGGLMDATDHVLQPI